MPDPVPGTIQVQPDSTGPKIDTSLLTRNDGTSAHRQAVVIGDPADPQQVARVTGGQDRAAVAVTNADLLAEIASLHATLREMNQFLTTALNN